MINKKMGIVLAIFSMNANAVGVAAHAEGSSAHASVHESVAVHESIISARYVPAMLSSSHAAQNASKSQNLAVITPAQVKGVLSCEAAYKPVGEEDGKNYQGCKIGKIHVFSPGNQEVISIDEFFNRYKPKDATKITMVIFSYNSPSRFEIYYD